MVLTALAWFLPDATNAPVQVSAGMLSRSAGVALLGLAMVAAGVVFRAATRVEPEQALAMARPRASEYRRGFGDRAIRAKAQPRQPTQRGVVVSLRRAVAEQANVPPIETALCLPQAEVARLQRMLQDRRAQLNARNAAMAERRFTRNDDDPHDPAPR
ncbi:MAG TPA: hypothetical protein VGF92_07515 [Stellaceae bacterium]